MSTVTTEQQEAAFVIHFDDGKANALGPDPIAELRAAIRRAREQDARVLVLRGREGVLSAGFDLKVIMSDPASATSLVTAGAELLLDLYELDRPVVIACTGHAIAAGALMLLACDTRVGIEGGFRIGLNEVGNGMTLPEFGVVLARERLSKRYYERAAQQAEIFSPEGARDAGFLDRVVTPEQLDGALKDEVARLASLDARAFAGTRERVRGAAVAEIRRGLASDVSGIVGERV